MKILSCGFLILNKKNPKEVLACLPNGRRKGLPGNYDIPKGQREDGESTLDTAIRELREETGYKITDERIYDCGLFKYLSNKDLYVYLIESDFDIHELYCDSKFERDGKMVNEIIGYQWTSDYGLFYKSLQPIVKDCIEHYKAGYLQEA